MYFDFCFFLKFTYYILVRRDGPTGPIVKFAKVGEQIFHQWECDGGMSTVPTHIFPLISIATELI